jgi:hypothetical protein
MSILNRETHGGQIYCPMAFSFRKVAEKLVHVGILIKANLLTK